MRAVAVLLLCGFLLLNYQGKMSVNADFVSDILADVSRMNQAIQKSVTAQVARAKGIAEQAVKKAKAGFWPAGSSKTGSSGVILSGTGSNSHFVSSGKDPKGKPYYMETDNVVVGDTLFHTERVYNASTKKIDERRYTVDLLNPNAKPVLSNGHQP